MNKKAFTLVELLAVVVILAVIALIVTPMIIKVLNEAEKKAFKESVNGMIRAVNNDSDKQGYVEMNYTVTNGRLYDSSNNRIHTGGGDKEFGSLTINDDGQITLAVHNDKWCATKEYDNNKIKLEDYKDGKCEIDGSSGSGEVIDGTVVYFDPKLGKKCDTYTEANSASGVKEGCMKFYTFGGNNDSDKVNLLLDHNTTAKVAWNTSNSNTDSSQINEKVATDTQGWVGNPRLITADEIAKITDNKTFNSATTDSNGWFYLDTNTTSPDPNRGQGTSKYAWLFDRTNNCIKYGCNIADSSTYGYWTSTAVSDSSSNVWIVYSYGHLNLNNASNGSFRGVRPVITVLKSNVS